MTERIGLLRGKGFDLGAYATRYPADERSMVRLLADQAAERGDATWLVFDGGDELSFADAHRLANRVA
jgi:carnitine-CoA ligase